jgi:acetylornithine deacetylase
VLWEAHQDTVALDGMTVDPLGGEVRDGRLYGRGACDVKGGIAAMLAAATALAEIPAARRATVWLAFTVNEECGFSGATDLARLWAADEGVARQAFEQCRGSVPWAELRRRRPAGAIVSEPTGLDVVVTHRGVVRWQCLAHGRAVHSSDPGSGANAVYAIAEAVGALRRYAGEVLARRPADPLCGGPTLCVTTIRGGRGPNTVPDLAQIDVDRRLGPHEDPSEAYADAVAFARQAVGDCDGCVLEHAPPWLASPGLEARNNREWAGDVQRVARRLGATGRIVGVPYGTNAARLAATGIPVVVFGPGSIRQAHTADEWIDLAELGQGARILLETARCVEPA